MIFCKANKFFLWMDKILFIGGRRQIYPAGPGQGPGGLWRGRALLQVLGNERV